MIHPAMKSFLLIIAMAFSALLSAAGQTARLSEGEPSGKNR